MAKDKGFTDVDIAIAVVGVIVQVGTAEAGGTNGDLEFIGGRSGKEAFFL